MRSWRRTTINLGRMEPRGRRNTSTMTMTSRTPPWRASPSTWPDWSAILATKSSPSRATLTGPSRRSNVDSQRFHLSQILFFFRFIKGLKTDLGSKFDTAGKLAKEEIDLVRIFEIDLVWWEYLKNWDRSGEYIWIFEIDLVRIFEPFAKNNASSFSGGRQVWWPS